MPRITINGLVKYLRGAGAAVIAPAALAVAVVTVGFYGGSSGGSEGRASRPDSAAPYAGPRIPDVMADPAERASWFVERFWDGFDFRDTTQLRPERLDPAFGEFASAALYADPAVRDASLRRMLDSAARGGEAALERFASLAEEYFGSRDRSTRSEDALICAMEKLLAMPGTDSPLRDRYRFLLEMALRNRPGTLAADILFTDRRGVERRLSSVRAEYTVLLFYDPACESCRAVERWIAGSPVYGDCIDRGRLKVVAIYAGDDRRTWLDGLGELPRSWIAGYDPQLRIVRSLSYDTGGVPLLYLLDRDKRVVLKEPRVDELEMWLQRNAVK